MDRKRIGWALVALGAVLVALSALAEPIGLGNGDGVGLKQTTGMIVGVVVVVAGVLMHVKYGKVDSTPTDV
jgi:hypothetical protein